MFLSPSTVSLLCSLGDYSSNIAYATDGIDKYLRTLPLAEICDFIKQLRGKTAENSERATVARALVGQLDDGPWTEEEFQQICDASPGSY